MKPPFNVTAVLIGCGATKTDHPTEAQYLYTGELFKARMEYAKATGEPWAILSARHGLVFPTQLVEPYDHTLPPARRDRMLWAVRTAGQIRRWLANYGADLAGVDQPWSKDVSTRIKILAEESYREPLGEFLRPMGIQLDCLFQHMGIGQQLHALKLNTNATA